MDFASHGIHMDTIDNLWLIRMKLMIFCWFWLFSIYGKNKQTGTSQKTINGKGSFFREILSKTLGIFANDHFFYK